MTAVTAPPKVARNLTRSFFEIGHKRCNSNDQISNPDIQVGELRATLLGNYSGISNGRPTDVEGVRWSGRQSCGATVPAGGGEAGQRPQAPGHTPAHNAVFTGTRQTRPTKKVTFPRDKAEKSPFQQHDLSILIVGPNQLKQRLSHTNTPKSHPSSNTQCPITRAGTGTQPYSHQSGTTKPPSPSGAGRRWR